MGIGDFRQEENVSLIDRIYRVCDAIQAVDESKDISHDAREVILKNLKFEMAAAKLRLMSIEKRSEMADDDGCHSRNAVSRANLS